MIQLLYAVILAEMALILFFLFKTPLRKLVILGLDRVKRGRGPITVKTISGTVFVVLMSSVYSMMKIQKRTIDAGAVNPTDQVLMAKHLLEASLMGFSLFLVLMIDRLHHYIRELRLLRKTKETSKKQNRGLDEGKSGGLGEIKSLEEEISSLREKVRQLESDRETKTKKEGSKERKALEEEISSLMAKVKQLESECDTKTKEAKAAEASAMALRKQSEGFLLEYDRLLEDNQNLRNQLQSFDRTLSQSDYKKNT